MQIREEQFAICEIQIFHALNELVSDCLDVKNIKLLFKVATTQVDL